MRRKVPRLGSAKCRGAFQESWERGGGGGNAKIIILTRH